MVNYLQDVAIIGAGLGGCALALALSAHGVPTRLYESRPANSDVLASGVVLTPNGLWVLDRLAVFERIRDRCYTTTHRVFKNDKDETTKKVLVSHESLYGYRNHRIWRKLLLEEMKKMLAERSIQIHYDSKFNGIVSDRSDGATFLVNQVECHASLVIGVDGIYSSIRQYLDSDVQPEYTGIVGVLSHIKRASVDWPCEDYEANATIQGKLGAIFWIAEDPKAEDIMTGMQVQYPEQSRDDLQNLQANKDKLVEFYRRGYDDHGPTARSIIDRVVENKQECFIWPYLRMPKLGQWYSSTGRVIVAGDGAHALPPSSGQGVNQALEDVYSLIELLVGANKSNKTWLATLGYWQSVRQERIDTIFEWVINSQNVQRMSEEERKRFVESKEEAGVDSERDDMSWLYQPKLESEVQQWLQSAS